MIGPREIKRRNGGGALYNERETFSESKAIAQKKMRGAERFNELNKTRFKGFPMFMCFTLIGENAFICRNKKKFDVPLLFIFSL